MGTMPERKFTAEFHLELPGPMCHTERNVLATFDTVSIGGEQIALHDPVPLLQAFFFRLHISSENHLKISGHTVSTSPMATTHEDILSNASSKAHAVVDSIAGAADQAASTAKPAIERVSAMAHQAVDKAKGVAEPTADWLVEQGETLNTTQKKLVANASDYISANPLKAVGIAVVAGYMLSRIIRR